MKYRKIAVYIRFGSHVAGFILPDDREAFRKYMNQETTDMIELVNDKRYKTVADNAEISECAGTLNP